MRAFRSQNDHSTPDNGFSWPDSPRQTAVPVARAGYPLIAATAFATAVLALLELTIPALAGLAATFCVAFFFRDPDRLVPERRGAVVAPADGRVVAVGPVEESPFFSGASVRIGIFMSVFNVHVNRVPFSGRVTRVCHTPGAFIAAQRPAAATRNEHNAVFMETADGRPLCVVQIAGLVARRILCGLQPGDEPVRGQRFGMICFGSRVDLYLPSDTEIQVRVGDRVKAATSIVGMLT